MTVLLETSTRFLEHRAGPGHPERPDRLTAVLDGVRAAGLGEAMVPVSPRPATLSELARAHEPGYLDALAAFCARGGGTIDADTAVTEVSWDVAVLAAGAGLDAVERLDRGEGDAAFMAVRPPGHHACRARAMGFCLLNNVAVTAAALADRGERVLIVDWDLHHGNGTQGIFEADPRVAYVSFHQAGLFPATGLAGETGTGAGTGTTRNLPLPAGTTGDVYRAALDQVVAPLAQWFEPAWVLVSCGFDPHRDDPLGQLVLSSGDFGHLAEDVMALAPPGRRLVFLEGGYDLAALSASAGACVAAMAGVAWRPEAPTSGGPGGNVVAEAAAAVARVVQQPFASGPGGPGGYPAPT